MATDIVNQRLPVPHSFTAQTLQASQITGSHSATSLSTSAAGTSSQVPPPPTLYDYFGNPVTSQGMDITPRILLLMPPLRRTLVQVLLYLLMPMISLNDLNCRSLSKPSSLDLSRPFSRLLTSSDMDILCLQETHSADPETHYCGAVNLNPSIQLDDAYVSTNGRLIICTVSHVNHLFRSFRLINIHAPATSYDRSDFYADLLQLPYFHTLLSKISSHSNFPPEAPTMIVGNFNYNFRHFPSAIVQNKLQTPDFITNLHINHPHLSDTTSTNPEDSSNTPTLDSNDSSNMPPAIRAQWLWQAVMLQHHYQECSHRLQADPPIQEVWDIGLPSTTCPQWTDDAMLSLHFRMRNSNHGRGLWRANPRLATNSFSVNQLYDHLDDFHRDLASSTFPAFPQVIWDDIKSLTRVLAHRVGRKQAEWRRHQLKLLQKKRNRILRTYKSTAILNDCLHVIEESISTVVFTHITVPES